MESDVNMHSILFDGANMTSMADVAVNVGKTVGLAGLSSIAGGFHNAVIDTASQSPGMDWIQSVNSQNFCSQSSARVTLRHNSL